MFNRKTSGQAISLKRVVAKFFAEFGKYFPVFIAPILRTPLPQAYVAFFVEGSFHVPELF
jgi:hypothetical protein